MYVFEQVLPYRATISIVLKWQFCVKWLSYLCKLSVNDVLLKFCGLIRVFLYNLSLKVQAFFKFLFSYPMNTQQKAGQQKFVL